MTSHDLPLRPSLPMVGLMIVGQLLANALGLSSVWPGALLVLGLCAGGWLAKAPQRAVWFLIAAFLGLGLMRQAQVNRADSQAFSELARLPAVAQHLTVAQGRLESSPRRSQRAWTLYLAPGSQLGVAGERRTFPGTIAVSIPVGEFDAALTVAVPGDRVRLTGRLFDLPSDATSPDPLQWHRERGATALLRANDAEVALATGPLARFQRFCTRLAVSIESRITTAMPPHEGALLLGLMTGRMHLLTDQQQDNFRRTGLMHVFSVSGLHTMVVGGLMILVLRFLGLGLRFRLLALALMLALFCCLVGVRLPVLRAAVLLLLFESREGLGRSVDPLAALGSVALMFLIIWPRALWQLDFQMTFLCMAAITFYAPWHLALQMRLGPRLGWGALSAAVVAFISTFGASIVIQLFLAPVLIGRFGEISLIAPLANALLLGIAVACVKLGFLGAILSLGFPALAGYFFAIMRAPLEVLNQGSAVLASPSWAVLEASLPSLPLVALYMAALIGGPWNAARRLTQPPRTPAMFLPGAALLAVVLLLWRYDAPRSGYEFDFLDVGQGDATLIRVGPHHWLVDGGPPSSGPGLVQMLRQRGVRRLAGVFATHSDADHIGGLPFVLDAFQVDALYVNGGGAPTGPFALLEDVVERRGIPVTALRRGAVVPFTTDGVGALVLHPTESFLAEGSERNEASLVLCIEASGHVVLLTGDAESEAEIAMLSDPVGLDATVLKAGHHGADTSSSAPFLEAVSPEIIIVSCGRANRFGHPAPAALERFAAIGAQVLRTDTMGSIRLKIARNGRLIWYHERGNLDFAAPPP